MKKIGIIIFIVAIVIGIVISNILPFGGFSFGSPISLVIGSKVKGSGNVTTERREIRDFDKIDVNNVFKVEIVAQKDFAVEIEGDDNLIPLIETKVKNGTLHIDAKKKFSTNNSITIKVNAPNIEKIDASGVARTNLSNLDNDLLDIDLSGATRVNVDGKTKKLKIDLSGASRVEALGLESDSVSIDASGASKASVNVVDNISSELSGASRVEYKGNPTNIIKRTSGASSMRQITNP